MSLKNKLPVICFDVGGLNEVVNQKNGSVVPRFDIQKMGDEILLFSRRNRTFLFDDEILKEYDWNIAGQKFLQAIQYDL